MINFSIFITTSFHSVNELDIQGPFGLLRSKFRFLPVSLLCYFGSQ